MKCPGYLFKIHAGKRLLAYANASSSEAALKMYLSARPGGGRGHINIVNPEVTVMSDLVDLRTGYHITLY